MRSLSPLAAFLGSDRRDRLLVFICLVLITSLAWAYLVHLARQMAPAMEYHAAMAAMGMNMDAPWTVVDMLFTFAMWVVMMVGMMAGAAAPVLLLFATVHAKRSQHGALSTVLMFGFGYLVVWIGFSACATVAQWALHRAAMLSPTMAASSPLLGGAILVAAGVYQLSPLKSACLAHCRSPLGFLMTSWREGKLGALQMGARHGGYCLGCCWALMCVLFVVGIMNLVWVMALTGLVLAEKIGPRGAVVSRFAGTAMIVAGIVLMITQGTDAQGTASRGRVPTFRVDPMWPKPLPNHWIIGAVAGVAVDKRDHVWIVHRASTLQPNETRSIWKAAPPVLEFDPEGKLVAAWGGPGAGYEWPELEHGIFVDDSDNVWLAAGGNSDAHILKFTRNGRFLMQIGRQGKSRGSNDTENLGAPANVFLDASANELYVADGYVNHRVIVFDATTGGYKRHWGAYGKQPDDGWFTRAGEKLPGPFAGAVQHENRPSQYDPDGPPAPQFRIVHAVRISKDGLVYVCDRTNDRLQVFRKDGTFVREVIIAKDTFGSGSVWDVGFSIDPQQAFLFINDGTNQLIYVIDRQTLEVVSTFGGAGRWAGQFYGAHNLAVNSKGDLFVTETYEGKRVQKFTNTGLGAPSSAP